MSAYTPPLNDMIFLLRDVIGLNQAAGAADLDPQRVILKVIYLRSLEFRVHRAVANRH